MSRSQLRDRRRAAGLACTAALLAAPLGGHAATTVVTNVNGYTLVGEKLQRFDELVVTDGRVVATHQRRDHAAPPAAARVIDGQGRTLLPGLIDAHGHIMELGFSEAQVRLADTPTLDAALEAVAQYAHDHPSVAWIQGSGWNQANWKLGRFPTAADLDRVEPVRPVALARVDGHAVWLNTPALRAAGITRDTPDPSGGRIERDAAGNPSGVLVDKAAALVTRVMPPPTDAERTEALRAALRTLASVGLTSVGDAGVSAEEVALYRRFADRKELTTRIYAMILDVGPDFATLSANGPLIGYGQDHLTVRAVKLLADGALGSRGAALLAPYADDPGQRGLLFSSDAEMTRKITTALRAGYQVNIHAIGDAANRQVLDGFEAAYRAVGGRELRNRIEHAQVIDLHDLPRLRQLDLIASMQPTHATSDMNMAEARVGAERLRGAYAWRTLLAQGTRIAGGSDFPVESPNPFFGWYSAVTRADHAGLPPGGWHREQALTRVEAFRAFTLDAAFAQHQEQSLGSLEPGKWADFIIVDADPFTIPERDIWKVRVEQTWVAGERVH
ncbi:MAG: amidohydrolase [Proteobacteria bacterium]|nr:amidohydrolase [Pseudomonadota bacterium]